MMVWMKKQPCHGECIGRDMVEVKQHPSTTSPLMYVTRHRSLLVYLPASESFYHFDSSQGRNEPAAALTAAKFWQMLGKKGA